jgi:hypothetical protein
MTQEINSKLEKLKLKIFDLKKKNINEAQTKEWLIKPFFELLGWDFSDPNEIIPEDDDLAGKRCDYSFCINSTSKFLVEAKPLNNSLDDNKMIFEKLNYCSNTGIPILIITNGDLYRIYYAELKGVGNDKLLDEFSLIHKYDEDLIEKLRKESFENDLLLTYARNISLYTNIKKAIEKLFQSSNKILITQINNIVKENLGHKFGDDEVDEALKQFRLEINTDIEMLQHNFNPVKDITDKPRPRKKDKEAEEKNWTIAYQFKEGRWNATYDLYKKLIKELGNKGLIFNENPTKFYIGLVSDKSNFCQIHGQKSGMKIWINLNISDISEQASLNVRDVSNIGHWGMGNIECVVKNELDFDWSINLIQKAYEK